jgi:hypothetical protein
MKQVIQYAIYDRKKRLTDPDNAVPYGTCTTLITAIENMENYGKGAIIVKQTCQVQKNVVLLVVKEEIENT